MIKCEGKDVIVEETAEGLVLTITKRGRFYLRYEVAGMQGSRWSVPEDSIWSDLFEDIRGNSGIDWLTGEIGLTGAPIIGMEVERDDNGDLEETGNVYWFPNYCIESPLETLLNTGRVVFTKAEENV